MFAAIPQNQKPDVLIADPDADACAQLSQILYQAGCEPLSATEPAQFLSALERLPVRMAFINFLQRGALGLTLLKTIKAELPLCRVVMICDAEDNTIALEAMRSGADDVLFKPLNEALALRVVRRELIGVLAQADEAGTGINFSKFERLTPRERSVLKLIVDGQSNKNIGLILEISPRTVEVHRARIMAKCEARNVADLVRIVLGK